MSTCMWECTRMGSCMAEGYTSVHLWGRAWGSARECRRGLSTPSRRKGPVKLGFSISLELTVAVAGSFTFHQARRATDVV